MGVAEIGAGRMTDGILAAMSKTGRDWIGDNAIEIQQRFGGEQSIQDVMKNSHGLMGALQKASFWPERAIDAAIARSTVIGAYQKYMVEHGLDPTLTEKANPEALRQALVTARKVVTSPLIKDAPQAISRGAFTNANMSASKSLFQFQSTMLRQFGYVRQDIINQGLRKGNYDQFLAGTLGMLAMLAGETGIVQGSRAFFGKPDQKGPNNTFAQDMALETIKRFPFEGIPAALYYGWHHATTETGVPILDTALQANQGIGQLVSGKNDYGRPMTRQQKLSAILQVSQAGAAVPFMPMTGGFLKNPIGGLPGTASAISLIKNQPKWFQAIEKQLKGNGMVIQDKYQPQTANSP